LHDTFPRSDQRGLVLVQESPWNDDFTMLHDLRKMMERLKQCAPDAIDWGLNKEKETIEDTLQC